MVYFLYWARVHPFIPRGNNMMATVRFEEEEGKTGGRLGVYERKSFTCRVPLGFIEYENAEEKELLRKIMVRDQIGRAHV